MIRSDNPRRLPIPVLIVCVLMLGTAAMLIGAPAPQVAQAQIFVTNTPIPVDPLAATVTAPVDLYALRLWEEIEMIDILVSQINRLAEGEEAQQIAVQLTQYELSRRFPGAPTNPQQRDRLLATMLTAPRGTVDLRGVARPRLIELANESPDLSQTGVFTAAGFRVNLIPLNLNGDTLPDAAFYATYPAEFDTPEELLYEDYFLARGLEDGGYALAAMTPTLPAAPFNDVSDISLGRAGDLNQDGVDELAVIVSRGEINQELLIYGWRGDQAASLILPGERLLFGALADWPFDAATISVDVYRLDSRRWNCQSALPVEWTWFANFFRPALAADYAALDTVGCDLLRAEPIFAQSADDAIDQINDLLEGTTLTDVGVDRGTMALAMLQLIAGERETALETVESLLPLVEANDWLATQVDAFVNITLDEDVTAVEVCSALLSADPDGACDIDQVLTQMFIDDPIRRDAPLVDQLEAMGLPVLEVVTVSQAGFLDRQVVSFNLTGSSWWSFAPTNEDIYVPEISEPPVMFESASFPAALIDPPDAAYDALLIENDAVGALNILRNEAAANPDVPLSAAARYLQALCYDLIGDRLAARQAYYELWRDLPDSPWGQLAGAHLELRQPSE
jgi:hypothetical protein